MRFNKDAVVRWTTETTGLIVFLGTCFMLVGLGIMDQSLARQLVGFAGALIVAMMTSRPLMSVNMKNREHERTTG